MRVLHTSDWHLGVSLEGTSRAIEHEVFLEWILAFVVEQQIDVLIVAGDIFDNVQPSTEAQQLYFWFLARLSKTPVRQTVLLGGNHDSASGLDAPRDLLSSLNVQIVGGFRNDGNLDRYLVPVANDDGETHLVIAAVPFVHEFRLGIRTTAADADVVRQQFRDRFGELYRSLADRAKEKFPQATLVGTGHMTCGKANREDYPFEIHQVGTIGELPATVFDERFDYVALGHVHRSYRIDSSQAWYSGSPIPLNVAESKVPRNVLVWDTQTEPESDGVRKPTRHVVPCSREIRLCEGTLDEVNAQVSSLTWETPMAPFVYVSVHVKRFDPTAASQVYATLQCSFPEEASNVARRGVPTIVQVRQYRDVSENSADSDRAPTRSLKDMRPEEVFRKLCEVEQVELDERLLGAFSEVYRLAMNGEEAGQ